MPSFRKKPIDLVVDVRSRIEFWMGHLAGATCIPVDRIAEIEKLDNVNKDSRILVYCASGARSAAAAGTLKTLGYRRVIDGGGIDAARGGFEA
jgi:rhodanese-related sulfurtransferase